MTLATSWKRIADWHEKNTPPGCFRLNPGTTPEAVSAFEQAIGANLPEDFRESLLLHDGTDETSSILWYGELLTLDEILRQWNMYRDWQARRKYAVPGSKKWVPPFIDGPIKPIWWNTKRIYVTDSSGDHLTLDLDPPEE